MSKNIKIKLKEIGTAKDVYLVAEIGINHEGNKDICIKMIEEAANSGAHAVKLQTIDPDENYSQDTVSYKLFKKAWLSPEETSQIFEVARSLGLEPFTTVGDFRTLAWVKNLNPRIFKISSGLITHIPLIKELATYGKHIFMSKGTANKKELDLAVNSVLNSNNRFLVLLHCVSSYPTPVGQINLSTILNLKKIYSLPIGYSDHALGFKACLAAVSAGSCVIEKHFTLDNKRESFDHRISLKPSEFSKMAKEINLIKQMFGNENIWVTKAEERNRTWMRRIIVARNKLLVNYKIGMEDLMFIRPSSGIEGLEPVESNNIVGKKVKKLIEKFKPIKFTDLKV